PFFGSGNAKANNYWMALVRQVLVGGYLRKDIETYGVIRITEEGRGFINNPVSFMMTEDHVYNNNTEDSIITATKSGSKGSGDDKLA
ncbi:ATP-dependent DNA helicase RecQ, partial [Aquimarina celericrescens]|nr:ATP-dependent DNA helicase RecQ [Aquimarina celericrescens]